MDNPYHSRLLERAQQLTSWSLRRLLGWPQRDQHDDQQQQQQQQRHHQTREPGTVEFAPDWRGIRQGWPAGVACAHLTESWFAAADDACRRPVEDEAAHDVLAEMLDDAVPFSLSDGGRADPRIVRAARSRLLRAFDEDVAGEGGDAFEIRKKKKRDAKGAQRQQKRHDRHQQQPVFHRFPDLPAELRLEIWRLALRARSSRALGVGVVRAWRHNWHADVPLPALAGVCREAYDVVLAATIPESGATGLTVHDRLDLGNSPDGRRLAGLVGCVGRLRGGVILGLNHFLGRGQAIQDDGLLGLDLARLAGGGGGVSLGRVLRELGGGGGVVGGVVLVTVQTVYVTLGFGAAAWEGTGGGVEGYLDRLQAIGEFDHVGSVDVLAGEGIEEGGVDVGMYWRQMIPHEACHHVTEVVPLGDTARMREILAVGEATGQWNGGRRARLLAMAHHSHAFCLDRCLGEWWARCGEETVRAGMERLMRADGAGVDGEEGRDVVLPKVVPAVRFKIQWPGMEAPKIVDGEVCWADGR